MDGSLCLVESTITSLAHRCRSGAVHPIIPGRCESSGHALSPPSFRGAPLGASPESITTVVRCECAAAPASRHIDIGGYGFRARHVAPPRNDDAVMLPRMAPNDGSVCCPTGKAAESRARRANQHRHARQHCLALVAKIKCFASDPKHLYKPCRPAPPGGAYHERQDTLARDAMDAIGIERRTRPARTAKPCGLYFGIR
jgi:hypothetical protein